MKKSLALFSLSFYLVACGGSNSPEQQAAATAKELCACATELVQLDKQKAGLSDEAKVKITLEMQTVSQKTTECMVATKRLTDEKIKAFSAEQKTKFETDVDAELQKQCPDLLRIMNEGM